MNLKINYTDNKGFFGEGYYAATITKIERVKTSYGPRLMHWFKISNEHGRTMLVNCYTTIDCTAGNELGKIYKIVFPGKNFDDFDTDDLIRKQIGIVLHKRIKKGKSYLNIGNVLPLKIDETTTGKEAHQDYDQLAKQLAIAMKNNPKFAQSLLKHVKRVPTKKTSGRGPKGVKKLGDVLEDNDNFSK